MGKVGERMTVKIVEEKKNPLLKREETSCIFEHTGKATPSREEMLPLFERALKTKKNLIIIDKIFSVKGKGESKVHVFTYKKKEDIPKEKLEKMQRRTEKKRGEEKKPPEEAKPEVEAEKKAEEPKEEEKPAEKKEEAEQEEKKEGRE
jgi:ribosomal protein S24E